MVVREHATPTRSRHRVSLFTLIVTLLLLTPLGVVIGTSVNPGEFALFPPSGISFRWFAGALENPAFRDSFYLSLEIAAITVVLGLLLAVPASVALYRGSARVRNLVRVAAIGPLIVPEVLLALGLLILFNSQIALGSGITAMVAGHLLVAMPLAIQVLLAGMASVEPNLEQAAWTLGASRLRAFWSVTMPALVPAIASAAVFMFIFSFDNVSISLFLSSPGQTTLPIQMYQYLEYRADPTIAAMSTILVGIGILAAIILGRLGSLGQLAGAGRKPR
jgi:putative spermidine/putrescine transport system permease protein